MDDATMGTGRAGRLAYAAWVSGMAALAWTGPCANLGPSAAAWGLSVPSLNPHPGSMGEAVATWGVAAGLAAGASLRLRADGASRGATLVPLMFLAVAATFAALALALPAGPAASILASFARTTGVLLVGLTAIGVACRPGEDTGPVATGDVVHLPVAKPGAREEAGEPVALAA